jgi:polyisoprenoid-binding protein YceI
VTTLSQWEFDLAHSSVSFWVRYMLVSRIRGELTRWGGTFHFDEAAPSAARVDIWIDAASIDTHEPERDAHLRSADFLDVERHPRITFKSTRVERVDDRNLLLAGALTVRGVTREVLLSVEYGGRVRNPGGGHRAGFVARTVIDRKAFGIDYNTRSLAVGDKIEIAIELQAVTGARVARPRRSAVEARATEPVPSVEQAS